MLDSVGYLRGTYEERIRYCACSLTTQKIIISMSINFLMTHRFYYFFLIDFMKKFMNCLFKFSCVYACLYGQLSISDLRKECPTHPQMSPLGKPKCMRRPSHCAVHQVRWDGDRKEEKREVKYRDSKREMGRREWGLRRRGLGSNLKIIIYIFAEKLLASQSSRILIFKYMVSTITGQRFLLLLSYYKIAVCPNLSIVREMLQFFYFSVIHTDSTHFLFLIILYFPLWICLILFRIFVTRADI